MIIYDLEIKRCILNPKEPLDPTLEYCKGWHDHENMGISCLAVYDYTDGRYRLFMDDNIQRFMEVLDRCSETREPVVGFNSRNFDNQVVLKSKWYSDLEKLQTVTYDILQEIWRAVTKREDYVDDFDYRVHAGYGLDQMVRANGLTSGKTGHGAVAPIDYQRQRFGSLIDYCLADVWNTKKLLDLIIKNDGVIKSPKGGEIKLYVPEEVKKWRVEEKE